MLALAGPARAAETLTITSSGTLGPVPVGATPTASFQIAPNPEGAAIHLEWTVRDGTADTDAVVRSGNVDVTPDVDGVVALTYETPTELGEGTYGLEVVASGDLPALGSASGSTGLLPVLVDNPAGLLTSLSRPVVYPMKDGYGDTVALTVEPNETVAVGVSVVSPTGGTFRSFVSAGPGLPATVTWNGRKQGGSIAPPGSYLLRAAVTDSADQVTVEEIAVEVSHARLRMVRSATLYKAKKTMVDAFVGKCSSMVSPSSHGWAKSQGYYSKSKCTRTANQADAVIGLHAWWLPPSYQDKYSRSMRVDTFGGKAKRERWAYLIQGYYRASDDKFVGRSQLTPKVAWHSGSRVNVKSVVRYAANGRPFLYWSTGLAQGSKYDVKSFRIVVDRQVLQDTDGTILLPRPATSSSRPSPAGLQAAGSISPRVALRR